MNPPPHLPSPASLTQEALLAFWDVIARRYPEAHTGDLSPIATIQLKLAAEEAVREWIANNVPAASPTQVAGE